MKEIVAIQVGSIITTDMEYVKAQVTPDTKVRLISRREVEFMAACDLGERWKALAISRTLCIQNDDNTIHPATPT